MLGINVISFGVWVIVWVWGVLFDLERCCGLVIIVGFGDL